MPLPGEPMSGLPDGKTVPVVTSGCLACVPRGVTRRRPVKTDEEKRQTREQRQVRRRTTRVVSSESGTAGGERKEELTTMASSGGASSKWSYLGPGYAAEGLPEPTWLLARLSSGGTDSKEVAELLSLIWLRLGIRVTSTSADGSFISFADSPSCILASTWCNYWAKTVPSTGVLIGREDDSLCAAFPLIRLNENIYNLLLYVIAGRVTRSPESPEIWTLEPRASRTPDALLKWFQEVVRDYGLSDSTPFTARLAEFLKTRPAFIALSTISKEDASLLLKGVPTPQEHESPPSGATS